jgi:hypothetical protein
MDPMMWNIFWVIVIAASIYTIFYGDYEQKLALVILDLNFILTAFLYRFHGKNWLDWPISIFATDAIAFCLLTLIALRSKRLWPLPVASLMFIPVMMPLIQYLGKNLVSDSLGWAQGIWAYAQLAILMVAAREHHRFENT